MNLMSVLMKFATPAMAAKVAGMLGVSSGVAQKLIAAAVPMVMSAILGASKKPAGAEAFGTAFGKLGSNPLEALGETLDSDPARAASTGGDLLSGILAGGTIGTMASKLAGYGGVDQDKASSLLGLAGSLAMGGIGKAAQEQNLDAAGALRMLENQKGDIAAALPADFAKMLEGTGLLDGLGAAAPAATKPAAAAAASRVTPTPPPAKKSGWMRWVWVALALALLAWLLPRFFGGEPEVVEVPVVEATVAEAPAAVETAADVDYVGTIGDALTRLADTLTGVTDAASAESALPTLEEVNAALATAQGAAESMPAESRTAIQAAVAAALPTITEQADRILAESGLSSVLKPAVDGILEKLQAFAA
jgi:hypothetical protein